MRNRLGEELDALNAGLLEMGAMIERSIGESVRAMRVGDARAAKSVEAYDSEIDRKEREIEGMCMNLLLRRQPVARDLLFISSALKMITDMERVGDQAADIAEIVGFLSQQPPIDHIPLMAEKASGMVRDAVDAFVARDTARARAVEEMDDEVDELFLRVKDELTAFILKNPDRGAQALDYLMIAKYLERIGDHAVNIAEWVEFAETGVHRGAEA